MRLNYFKHFLFSTYAPMHPHIRNGLVACKLARHSGRQQFLLGHLASNVSIDSFLKRLEGLGYRTQFLAWKDDNEVASLCLPDGCAYQYHLRIFTDGEVRGHYEYAPEKYLFAHLASINFLDRREFFLQQFQKYIVPACEYEFIEENRPFVTYARAFICFFYRRNHKDGE